MKNGKQKDIYIVFKTFIFGCATVLGIDLIIPVLDNFSESTFKGETYYFFDSFIRAGFVEEIFKEVGTSTNFSSAYMIDYIKEMIEPVSNAYSDNPFFDIVNNTKNT